jgi:outer membrane protein assembly factor BamB
VGNSGPKNLWWSEMSISLKRIAIAVVAVLLVGWVFGLWTQSRRRAAVVRMMETPSAGAIPPDSRLMWQFKSETAAFSSIALGPDGTIYAGANNSLYALAPNGNLKWKKALAGFLFIAAGGGGQMYIASSHGLIFGVSEGGAINWDPKMGLIGFNAPPAIGANGNVIFVNSVGDIFSFHPQDSLAPQWSHSTFREGMLSSDYVLPGNALVGQIATKAAPAIYDDETIALPRQRWLHLFNPDGAPVWLNELTAGDLGPAALGEDGTIYVPDDRRMIFAVDRRGDLKWKFEADGLIVGSAVVGADGTIYFATPGSVYALGADGSVKWQVKPPQSWTTSPTLAADGTLYVGGPGGLFALHGDGSPKWNMRSMSVSGTPTIATDGSIYFPCGYYWICAVRDEGSPLAKSPWPKMYHDPANSSRILTTF